MRLHVRQQLLEIPYGSMWLHSKFQMHEHHKLRDFSFVEADVSDSFPTQIGHDKSSRLCLLHSDVLEALESMTARAKKNRCDRKRFHRRVKGEGGGQAGQVIDGSEVVKISLSAWSGSDCTVGCCVCSIKLGKGHRITGTCIFYIKVCTAAPVTWMTAEKWLPTSGHKQSSAAFSLEPQTKDKESLSCQICVFDCSEVHEKTVCIIHSSELGGGVGVNMTPYWLLLSPAGGGGRNRSHIAQGFPNKWLCSAEVMNWLC